MSSYGALLARPAARSLARACAIAWLAFAAVTLALVLLVRDASGGGALAAGAVVAAYALAAGALAPLRGRAVDRGRLRAPLGGRAASHCAAGQRAAGGRTTVVVVLAGGHAALLLALVAAAGRGAPAAVLIVLGGLAGASAPPLIALARTLWRPIAGPELTRAGYALTALLGDAGGVLGPPAAAMLATGVGPGAAVAAVALAPLGAALALRRLPLPLLPASPSFTSPIDALVEAPEADGGLAWLVAADAVAGACLGAVEVTLAARSGAAAAVPLAAFAVASMGAAWWSGRAAGAGPRRRLAAGLALLGGGSALALLAAPATVAVAGAGYGLLTVALLELLDGVAPPHRQVEAFTWLTSAQALGLALGSVSAGALLA